MTNFIQYFYTKSAKRKGTHFIKYGPSYLSIIAGILVMVDLTSHIVDDNDMASHVETSTSVACTWCGYTCLFIAVFWQINFISKLSVLISKFKQDLHAKKQPSSADGFTASTDPLLPTTRASNHTI